MSTRPRSITEKELRQITLKWVEDFLHVRLDILALEKALRKKGLISDADLADAVQEIERERAKIQDDLESNPEKLMALLRGKQTDVQ